MKSLGSDVSEILRQPNSMARRFFFDRSFRWLCQAVAAASIAVLAILLYSIFSRGIQHINYHFLFSAPNSDPEKAGIFPALMGTFWTCAVCGLMTLPIGVGTAILLEEFRPRNLWLRRIHAVVQLNITNLAGVPSVVYGLVGLAAFVSMFGLFDRPAANGEPRRAAFEFGSKYYDQFFTLDDQVVVVPVLSSTAPETTLRDGMAAFSEDGSQISLRMLGKGEAPPTEETDRALMIRWNETPGRIARHSWYHFRIPFGRGVLAGSLTLMLVILPVIIIAAQESLRAVPSSLREASLGMGATPWQTVWNITLPASLPGIMTGFILAMSRAVGEAAPIMMISGVVFVLRGPTTLMSDFTVLSLQIFDWASSPEPRFQAISAAAIIVLLVVLMCFNLIAIILRQFFSRPLS